MKLTIERAALLRSLAHVQSVVERRTTIPILSNVMLRRAEGPLGLTATDMDLAIVEQEPAEVAPRPAPPPRRRTRCTTSCASCPRAARSSSRARRRRQPDASAPAGRRFELPCLPPDEFPAMTEGDLAHSFALPAGDLAADRPDPFRDLDRGDALLPQRHLPPCRQARAAPSVLRGVATDGHRLARVEMPLPEGAEGMPAVIVPRKTVGEVRKLIDESDGAVEVALSRHPHPLRVRRRRCWLAS